MTVAVQQATFEDALSPFIADGCLTHYYPLTSRHQGDDIVGGLSAANVGSVTFDETGATFDGSNYLNLGDHDDFSVATTGALTVLMFVSVADWRGGPGSSGERVYIASKGKSFGYEWGFRQYREDGTGQAPDRRGWVNFYHWNLSGGYGAGVKVMGDPSLPTGEFLIGGECRSTHGDIAAFRDGAETQRRALSGTLSSGIPFNVDPRNGGAPVLVGHRADGEGKFIGRVRRLMFFNRALSPDEHAAIRDAATLPDAGPEPVAPIDDHPIEQPPRVEIVLPDGITHGSPVDLLLTCAGSQYEGTVTVEPFSREGDNVTLGILASAHVPFAPAYADEVLADSPYAYYRLNDASGNPVDSSGNGRSATAVAGTPVYNTSGGPVSGGGYLTFDGSAEYVTLGNLDGFLDATGDPTPGVFAVEFWVRSTATAKSSIMGTFNDGSTTGLDVRFNADNADATDAGEIAHFVRDDVPRGRRYGTSGKTLNDGDWHHIFITTNDLSSTLYIDGSSASWSSTGSTLSIVDLSAFAYDLVLGARNLRGTIDSFTACDLAEVAFYRTNPSSARIAAHYAAA